jgi:hypothetical protein
VGLINISQSTKMDSNFRREVTKVRRAARLATHGRSRSTGLKADHRTALALCHEAETILLPLPTVICDSRNATVLEHQVPVSRVSEADYQA